MTAPVTTLHRRNGLLAKGCRVLLRLTGWRLAGLRELPNRCIILAAPHTSNWDFVWAMLAAGALGVRLRFLGKHTLFRPPLGFLMHQLGGLPVDRSAPQDLVATLSRRFQESETLVLLIPPEGSRSYRPRWKSGFLHISRGAEVPLVAARLDYSTRIVTLSDPIPAPKSDVADLMSTLRSFYRGAGAKRPSEFGPVAIVEEELPEHPAAGSEA